MSIYDDAVTHFGATHQKLKAAEELSELSASLIKYALAKMEGLDTNNGANVAEELADVEIMLEQLRVALPPKILCMSEIFKKAKLTKLKRAIQDQASGQYNQCAVRANINDRGLRNYQKMINVSP